MQLVNRLIINVCEIPGEKLKSGQLAPYEWVQLDQSIKKLYGAPLYIDDTPSLSIFELRTKARRLVREHQVGLIMIDYLQLMNASGMNFGSRQEEVSNISRALKQLAKRAEHSHTCLVAAEPRRRDTSGQRRQTPAVERPARIGRNRAGCRHSMLHPPPGILPHLRRQRKGHARHGRDNMPSTETALWAT